MNGHNHQHLTPHQHSAVMSQRPKRRFTLPPFGPVLSVMCMTSGTMRIGVGWVRQQRDGYIFYFLGSKSSLDMMTMMTPFETYNGLELSF